MVLEHLPPHHPGLHLPPPPHRLHQLAPLGAVDARLPHLLRAD